MTNYILKLLTRLHFFILILLLPPQYLAAHANNRDTFTINNQLVSAQLNRLADSANACTQRSLSYEKLNKFDSSLYYLKLSNVLKDSILEENKQKWRELEIKYGDVSNKYEKQIVTIKYKNTKKIFLCSLAFFILLVMFSVYLSHSNSNASKIITEKNKSINEKNKQLEDANEMLRQFAFASAHDLKEPLRSIHSFTNILEKKYVQNMPSEAKEYMGFITRGVKRMETLLDSLLQFSTLFSKDNISEKENDNILILSNIFQQYQDQIDDKRVVISYPSVLPNIIMSEGYLIQLWTNLISNAMKYSKNNLEIKVGYKTKLSETVFYIKDNGIGIDKSYGNKIFKLFQRLDASTRAENAGVGLSICKNIVDKYNGQIWFDSELGEGSTFYFSFPNKMICGIPQKQLKNPQQQLTHEKVVTDLKQNL